MIGNNEHKMEGYEIGNRESLDRGELVIYPCCSGAFASRMMSPG